MKHVEMKAMKQQVVGHIVNEILTTGAIKLASKYRADPVIHTLWSTPSYFVNDLKKLAPSTVSFAGKRGAGTIARPVNENSIDQLIMGGLFPHVYTGVYTDHPVDGMTKVPVSQWPKMFAPVKHITAALWRGVDTDGKIKYVSNRVDGKRILYRQTA